MEKFINATDIKKKLLWIETLEDFNNGSFWVILQYFFKKF